jgi:hypothetical protein
MEGIEEYSFGKIVFGYWLKELQKLVCSFWL